MCWDILTEENSSYDRCYTSTNSVATSIYRWQDTLSNLAIDRAYLPFQLMLASRSVPTGKVVFPEYAIVDTASEQNYKTKYRVQIMRINTKS